MSNYREKRAKESKRKLNDGAFSLRREVYGRTTDYHRAQAHMRADILRFMYSEMPIGLLVHPNVMSWAWAH